MTAVEILTRILDRIQFRSSAIMHEHGTYDGSDNTWSCAGENGAFVEGLDEAHDLVSQELSKIKPVLSGDCNFGDHIGCAGEEPALWPDGETTVRKCSCDCHKSTS